MESLFNINVTILFWILLFVISFITFLVIYKLIKPDNCIDKGLCIFLIFPSWSFLVYLVALTIILKVPCYYETKTEYYYVAQKIYSCSHKSLGNINGTFTLGCGNINTDMSNHYLYFTKKNNGYVLNNCPSKYSIIYEIDTLDTPYIKQLSKITKYYEPNNKLFLKPHTQTFVFSDETKENIYEMYKNLDKIFYELYVPKGAIVEKYSIDF